jgi:hypothetical protein
MYIHTHTHTSGLDMDPKLGFLLNIHDIKKTPSILCLSFLVVLLNLIKRLWKQVYLLSDNNISKVVDLRILDRLPYRRLLMLGVRYFVEWKETYWNWLQRIIKLFMARNLLHNLKLRRAVSAEPWTHKANSSTNLNFRVTCYSWMLLDVIFHGCRNQY